MKFILFTLLFSLHISIAQTKDCEIDFEEKTDSTYIKKTKDILIHEKVFGNTSEFVFVSLIDSDGVLLLHVQYLQKSSDFIKVNCTNKTSKITLQLMNGKFYNFYSYTDESCSSLSFDDNTKTNIRIFNNYYTFSTENFEDLKTSPISLMRINFLGDKRDLIIKDELSSEALNTKYNPSAYFINHIKCLE